MGWFKKLGIRKPANWHGATGRLGGLGRAFHRVTRPPKIIRRIAKPITTMVHRTIKNPVHALKNLTPWEMNKRWRHNANYRRYVTPVIKVGAAVGAAYITGGGSLLAMGAGAATSVATGGLSSKPFNPVRDVVAPAAVGWAVGAIQAAGGVGQVTSGMGLSADTAGSAIALVGKLKGLRKPKRRGRAPVRRAPAPVMQSVPNNQTKKKGVNWGAAAAGAGAGFLVAGPVGAVVGGGAGAMIKKGGA